MRRSRFTLLELLTAAMASAVLMAALLTVVAVAWKLQERAVDRQAVAVPRDAVSRLMRGDLLAAVPPNGILAGPLLAEAVEVGDQRTDTLEFVAAIGGAAWEQVGPELAKINYYLLERDTPGEYDLIRTEESNLLAVEIEEPEEIVLLRGVVGFELNFHDGTDWVTGWDSTVQENQLPVAVQVRILFAERDGRIPLPLALVLPFEARSLLAAVAGGQTP